MFRQMLIMIPVLKLYKSGIHILPFWFLKSMWIDVNMIMKVKLYWNMMFLSFIDLKLANIMNLSGYHEEPFGLPYRTFLVTVIHFLANIKNHYA